MRPDGAVPPATAGSSAASRFPWTAPDLTEHRRAALAQGLAHAGPRTNTEYVRASYEAARTPVHYRDFVVATDGHLWVRLFEQRPGDPVPYLILSPAGSARARVSLPSGGRVLSVDQH